MTHIGPEVKKYRKEFLVIPFSVLVVLEEDAGPEGGSTQSMQPVWLNFDCLRDSCLESLLDSGWTLREQDITRWLWHTGVACYLSIHALIYLNRNTLIFLLFYIFQQLLLASFNEMTFNSKMTPIQRKGWAVGISERWGTWAVEASCLPCSSGLTTFCLYDLEQQVSSAIVSSFAKCK